VNVFVLIEVFYLFNCRSLSRSMLAVGLFGNPLVFVGTSVMLLAQVLFTYLPFMNAAFHSAPVSGASWLRAAAAGLAVYLVIEGEKTWRGRLPLRVDSGQRAA
jgi:magnesium-transporting ATPase (P-type)